MAERLRVRCPACLFMTNADEWFKDKEVVLEAFNQTFGGKVKDTSKGKGHGKGSTKGIIEYTKLDKVPIDLKEAIKQRLKLVLESM